MGRDNFSFLHGRDSPPTRGFSPELLEFDMTNSLRQRTYETYHVCELSCMSTMNERMNDIWAHTKSYTVMPFHCKYLSLLVSDLETTGPNLNPHWSQIRSVVYTYKANCAHFGTKQNRFTLEIYIHLAIP